MTRGMTPATRTDRLRALIDTAPALYCVAPAHAPLAFEYVGANCRQLLGYDVRELTASSEFWRERVHPSDRRRVERAFGLGGRALHTVLPAINYRLRGADGRYRQIEHHCRLTRLGAGSERMLVSVCIIGSEPANARTLAGGTLGTAAAGGDAPHQISRVAERLAICADLDDLQQAFDDTFVDLFGGDHAAVLAYEPRDRSLHVVGSCGDGPARGTVYPGTACLAVLAQASHRNAGAPHALARAAAIHSGLHRWQAPIPGAGTGPITASIGVASFPLHGLSAHELIAAADGALYRAKRAGRDCVVAAEVGRTA